MKRGWFITFEGPEGSGKSTQVRRLVRALQRRRRRVLVTHEPGGTPMGRAIRDILLHRTTLQLTPLAELALFMASRAQLVSDVIAPALRRGTVVICDRFLDSTKAYQGGGSGLDRRVIDVLGHTVTAGVHPDVTFLLDLDPAEGLRRRGRRRDRMEAKTLRYHRRVRRAYLAIARREPRRVMRLDARQSIDILHQQILRAVEQRLRRSTR